MGVATNVASIVTTSTELKLEDAKTTKTHNWSKCLLAVKTIGYLKVSKTKNLKTNMILAESLGEELLLLYTNVLSKAQIKHGQSRSWIKGWNIRPLLQKLESC